MKYPLHGMLPLASNNHRYYVWLGILVLLGYTIIFQVCAFLFLKWFAGECCSRPCLFSLALLGTVVRLMHRVLLTMPPTYAMCGLPPTPCHI